MPRYLLMAVEGLDLEVYGQHLRICELMAIAEATGADLVESAQQPSTTFDSDTVSCASTPRTLEMLLIEASGKAQFLLDADDADEKALLSIFTDAERKQFLSLLTRFVETEPESWIS